MQYEKNSDILSACRMRLDLYSKHIIMKVFQVQN